LQRLAEPRPSSEEQVADEPVLALQVCGYRADVGRRENNRQVAGLLRPYDAVEPRQLDLHDFLVQKQDRRTRLVLRRGRDFAVDGEVREKVLNLSRRHAGWVTVAVKQDESPNPQQVLLLGAVAVMQFAEVVANPVEEAGPGVHANILPVPIDARKRRWSSTHKGLQSEQAP